MNLHRISACAALAAILGASVVMAPRSDAQSYYRISGEGSSWAAGFIDAMRVNVKQFGITVDYNPSGSSVGRKNWLNGTVDFAASDIPFQFKPEDGSAPENPAGGSYAYIPVTAGGTSFMYNLKINGRRVTNLRLSGENVAKVFTGTIKKWSDPAIQTDNPGLTLPDRAVVPVVRSDGSGSTAQFTLWMIKQHGRIWQEYCERSRRAPACGFTSFYPTVSGMIAQSGDVGVAGYVAQNFAEGAIGYVNYSYALGAQFPVAKVLNSAGYYTEPTPENVAVSLLRARINTDSASANYLTQILDDVYSDRDPRNYQLSSYSYFILPTKVRGQFTAEKGRTLGAFSYYSMCQGQQQSASLGYSPMPINLVEASFEQIRKIPGVVAQDIDITKCKNPTFSENGTNTLATNAPQPQDCDRQGPGQCSTGTGGAKKVETPVKTAAPTGTVGATTGAGVADGARAAQPATAAGTRPRTTASGPNSRIEAAAADVVVAANDFGLGVGDAGGSDLAAASLGEDADDALGGVDPVAAPTVLAGTAGWAASQTLLLLVATLTLAMVVVPPVAWRVLASRRPRPSSAWSSMEPT